MKEKVCLYRFIIFLVMTCMILVWAAAGIFAKEASIYPSNWPKRITLAGGVMGASWYPLMIKYSEVLMREIPGLNVTVIEGGSLANARVINKGYDAQAGMCYADIVVKARAGEYDKTKMTNVLMTNTVLSSAVQFMVPKNSKIQSLKEVFDKRIGSSPIGTGGDIIWRIVLAEFGKTYKDIRDAGGNVSFVTFSEQASLIKDGNIDVALFAGPVPMPAAMNAETSVPLRVLSIPDDIMKSILAKYPYFFPYTIKSSVYKGMDRPAKTLGIPGVFIVNKNLPNDFVYKVLEVIMGNMKEIKAAYPFVNMLGWEQYKTGIPEDAWHPAAKRLYEEHFKKK